MKTVQLITLVACACVGQNVFAQYASIKDFEQGVNSLTNDEIEFGQNDWLGCVAVANIVNSSQQTLQFYVKIRWYEGVTNNFIDSSAAFAYLDPEDDIDLGLQDQLFSESLVGIDDVYATYEFGFMNGSTAIPLISSYLGGWTRQ